MPQNAAGLIEDVYAITVDPARYEQLMRAWEDYIETRVQALESQKRAFSGDEWLQRHLKTALEISGQVGRHWRTGNNAEAFLAGLPVAAMIVDAHFAITAANEGARRLLVAKDRPRLDGLDINLDIDDLSVRKLRSWMAGRTSANPSFLLLPCFLGRQATSSCLAATRVDFSFLLIDLGVRADGQSHAHFLLMTVDLQFDRIVDQALSQAYRLSTVEAAVAIALAKVGSPSEIAAQRDVSLHTVRTQIKVTLRKLGAAAIPDLVRIVSGFAATVAASRNLPSTAASQPRRTGWRRVDPRFGAW